MKITIRVMNEHDKTLHVKKEATESTPIEQLEQVVFGKEDDILSLLHQHPVAREKALKKFILIRRYIRDCVEKNPDRELYLYEMYLKELISWRVQTANFIQLRMLSSPPPDDIPISHRNAKLCRQCLKIIGQKSFQLIIMF